MAENTYNEIPYTTFPRLQTHPDRIAAVGSLFGMNPAPVNRCRVLEVGCGDASNLIPMAYALPESRFTGIDLADAPIEAGRRTADAVGLRNLSLLAKDLRDVDSGIGEFDYIVAHGVYSWVPADVREKLMALCAASLAPQGIAFISYHVYPGAYSTRALREMMLYHIRNVRDSEKRIDGAIEMAKLLVEGQMLRPSWQASMEDAVKVALVHGRYGLFHDEIEESNDPVYFHEFMAHAARHGLQYVGEAELHTMFDHQGKVAWTGDDVLEREQYLDFLRARRFRQTLLCRNDVALRRPPAQEQMDGFLFSAPAKPQENGEIEGLHGIRISAGHEEVHRVAKALGETFPLPLTFDDLVPYAGSAEALREMVFGLTTSGFVNLHVFDFPCQEEVTARPKASGLVRHQAAQSQYVTSLSHHTVELDEVGRFLVQAMDGTRDHEQLALALANAAEGVDLETIRRHLPGSLEWMAGKALLEG